MHINYYDKKVSARLLLSDLVLSNFYFLLSFQTLNHQYDYTFDWTMLKQKAAQSAAAGVTGTTAAATAGATPISGGR